MSDFFRNEGKWTVSDDEEQWPCEDVFATRKEALDYARREGMAYVGRLARIEWPEAVRVFDVERLVEQLEEDGFGEQVFVDDVLIEPDARQRAAIESGLDAAFRSLLEAAGLWPPHYWRIVDIGKAWEGEATSE